MKLGNWNVKNYWWLPSEQNRINKIVKALLKNGWEFNVGEIVNGNVIGWDSAYYPGYQEIQIQTSDGHNEI